LFYKHGGLMEKKFLIHTKQDSVGVAVYDIREGEEVEGVFMDDLSEIPIKSKSTIPLGHKIALLDIKKEQKVIEYGEQIGIATQDIAKGSHVHVHNIKSLRWGN
jgi:(2R)-sulfolactate sulfo-lyase subunit alpha